ncbi:ClbS/DfsB family four-helix bundle protein [Neisseria sp. Ec49-e6-T10]|uniref:ClbS/DfsB family four-helix bundle protein n=1 Tax=Neisseria sp. Ec49-e6-T10 TaxID=3140744 RepID=UPI003EC06752
MPRPTDKDSLLTLSQNQFNLLLNILDSFESHALMGTFPFDDRDHNIRDVIAHLYEWHLMFLSWYEVGMSGNKPSMPAIGFSWKTLPELNFTIWQKYQSMDLDTTLKNFKQSHQTITHLIQQHSNEELFTKQYYFWTGSTSLGAYFISSTSSHYDWAIKKIKKYKKTLTLK